MRATVLSNDLFMLREAALAGTCLAALPAFAVADDLTRGRLIAVLREHPLEALWSKAIYPRQDPQPAKTRLLLDFLARRYQPVPPWEKDLAHLEL